MKKLPFYSYLGLIILTISGILIIFNVKPVSQFFTPIMWTGYILLIDGFVWLRTNQSLIKNHLNQFIWMLPLSVFCWLIFEAFNIHIKNWHYEGLPDSIILRWIGYGWSFATIFPGLFETSQLLESFGFKQTISKKSRLTCCLLIGFILLGLIFLIVPLLLPVRLAQYMAAPIWIGFIFLLEPFNYWMGAPSILRDWEFNISNKIIPLMISGLVCGFLWEFWNYWAETKWIYDVPICQNMKIFEMVLPGYLGFIPFAVECYVMYHFLWHFIGYER